MNKSASLFSLILTTSILGASPLLAQTSTSPTEKPVEVQRPNFSPVMPVKIKPRQGGADSISKAAADIDQGNALDADTIGLYTTASEGSLGGALWQNYSAAEISKDLANIPDEIASETMRTLLLRALLTTPDAKPEKDSNEAFSARLEKLVSLGSYDETFRLYNKLEGNIPSAIAALAGTRSAFVTGRTGLSCLEEKALDPAFKAKEGNSFWSDLNEFCDILLKLDQNDTTDNSISASKAYIAAKNIKSPATLSELNNKSVVEILALKQSGLLPDALFTVSSAKTLKPSVVSLLLSHLPLSAEARLSLMSAAVEKGLKSKEDLANEYLTLSRAPLPTPGYWKNLLDIYAKLPSSTNKAELLRSVLLLSEKPDYTSLQPFAGFFSRLDDVSSFSKEEARKVLSLLIRSKNSVSGKWVDKALESPKLASKESVTDLEVIQALSAQLKREVPDIKDSKKPEVIEITQLHALSLILNDEEAEDKAKNKSYENVLSLTAPTDYVMPTKEFMNNLAQASARQDTGKVILYSLQALNGHRVSQLHPLALYRIMEALKSVGLVEEVRSLVHEALADMIE